MKRGTRAIQADETSNCPESHMQVAASVELDLWSDDRDLWKIQRNVLSL